MLLLYNLYRGSRKIQWAIRLTDRQTRRRIPSRDAAQRGDDEGKTHPYGSNNRGL